MLIFCLTITVACALLILPFPLSPRIRRQEAMRGHSSTETQQLLDEAVRVLEETIDRELIQLTRR